MSYGPPPGRYPAPYELLSDSRWKLRQSLWLLFPLIGVCCLGWAGWLMVAIRTGRRRYWVYMAVYVVLTITLPVVGAEINHPVWENVLIGGYMVTIGVCALHAIIENPGYLRFVAHNQPWMVYGPPMHVGAPHPQQHGPYAGAHGQHPGAPRQDFLGLQADQQAFWGQPGQPHPGAVPPVGPGVGQVPPDEAPTRVPGGRPGAAAGHPGGPEQSGTAQAAQQETPQQAPQPVKLDLNKATVEQLISLPGIDAAAADGIIAARRARPFADSDDVVARSGLQPHQWVRIRDLVDVAPPTIIPPLQEPPTHGRILDL